MGQWKGLGRQRGREQRRIPVDHRPKPAGSEWLGRVEGCPPGELGRGLRRESGVIPLGGPARIELGWPLRGCRYGGDPPAVGSGEAWLEEQAGGGGLGRGVRIQGLGSLGTVWEEAESQPHTGEVETLKGPRSGEGVGGSLWG